MQDATSAGFTERISISFGLLNVTVASRYLVIDKEAVCSMMLGQVLKMENLLLCIMSAIHNILLAGLPVSPQAFGTPTLTGFVSPIQSQ